MGLRDDASKIGRLSAAYMLGGVATQALAFFLLPVFTRYLPPEQMGIVGLAGRVTAPTAILVQLGLWSSLKSHYFRFDEADRRPAIRTVLIGQLTLTGFLCLVLSVAGIWLAQILLPNLPLHPDQVFSLWLMVIWGAFFSSFIALVIGLKQLHERAGAAVGMNALRALLQAGFGVVAVVGLGWQGFGRQGTIFAASIVVGVIAIRLAWGHGQGRFNLKQFGRILRTGLTFVPHGLSGILALAINAWLLNRLVSTAALGVYGIALMFGQLVQLSLQSFGNAAYPTLARMMSDGSEESRRRQSRIYTLLITGIGTLSLGIVLFAPVAIEILTVPRYHGAIPIIPILALAWLFQGFYWIASNRVFFLGGGHWLASATVSSVIVSAGLSLLLIPGLAAHGAAWALVGCFLVRFVVIAIIGERLYPLPWQIGTIARVLAGVVALWASDYFLLRGLGPWSAIPFKLLLLLAMIPMARMCNVVTGAEIAEARAAVREKLRALFRRPQRRS